MKLGPVRSVASAVMALLVAAASLIGCGDDADSADPRAADSVAERDDSSGDLAGVAARVCASVSSDITRLLDDHRLVLVSALTTQQQGDVGVVAQRMPDLWTRLAGLLENLRAAFLDESGQVSDSQPTEALGSFYAAWEADIRQLNENQVVDPTLMEATTNILFDFDDLADAEHGEVLLITDNEPLLGALGENRQCQFSASEPWKVTEDIASRCKDPVQIAASASDPEVADAAVLESLESCESADAWLSALRLHPASVGAERGGEIGLFDVMVQCGFADRARSRVCVEAEGQGFLSHGT